jgi:hypothetical protein
MTDTKEGDTARLVDFLKDRDAPCPLCGYNLRNLAAAVCPECAQELRLTVGVRNVRFGWFLAAVTPFLFSGIAAVVILIFLLAALVMGAEDEVPPGLILLELIGFTSGSAGLVLILRRHRFLKARPQFQRTWAIGAWAIHILPFLVLLALVMMFA